MPHFDLKEIIMTTGYFGIFGMVFAESGLLFGFFFPGDSLLITAGLLASQNFLDITVLLIGGIIAAISGDSVGYWFGKKTGPKIFKKEDSLLFHKKNIIRANQFYEKHGGKTIIIARFMPFIRTFAPIVAGIGKMEYRRFLFFNVIGGIIWVGSTTLGGYLLGSTIPGIEKYFHLIILVVILVSASPGLYHFWKEYRQPLWAMAKKKLKIN
ncbi:DedA family protein [Patescibacteria group bacterium]